MAKIKKASKNKTVKTIASKTVVSRKASGRMPAWATTKTKKAYVIAERIAGNTYSNEAYPAYRKALKASAITAKVKK